MASLLAAKSILIHIERLSSHLLSFDGDTDVAIYCTLGQQVLKTATATVVKDSDAPINFDSLLQFPLNYSKENTLTFILKDKSSQRELGRYELHLSVFDNQEKPSHLVRVKIKSQNRGVGLLDMKIRVSENEIEKAASAKYVKHTRTSKSEKSSNVPDELGEPRSAMPYTVNSLIVSVYKVRELPKAQESLHCVVRLGKQSMSLLCEGACEEDTIADGYSVDFNGAVQFPYDGERFLHFELTVGGSAASAHPTNKSALITHEESLCVGEIDMADFLVGRPNVLIGCVKMESVDERRSLGTLFIRLERCTVFAEENKPALLPVN